MGVGETASGNIGVSRGGDTGSLISRLVGSKEIWIRSVTEDEEAINCCNVS